jgi:hypothetical protein
MVLINLTLQSSKFSNSIVSCFLEFSRNWVILSLNGCKLSAFDDSITFWVLSSHSRTRQFKTISAQF